MTTQRTTTTSSVAIALLLVGSVTVGRWGGQTAGLSLLAALWGFFGILALAFGSRKVDLALFRHPAVGGPVMLLTLLPLLGALMGRGAISTAAAGGVGVSMLGAFAIGQRLRRDISDPLLLVGCLHLMLVVARLASPAGLPILAELHSIDLESKFAAEYYIVARPSGLFLNPNDLGTYSALVFAFALSTPARRQTALVFVSAVCAVASGSRGALLAMGAVALVVLGRRVLSTRSRGLSPRRLILPIGFALGGALAFGPEVLTERIRFANGLTADASVAGRLSQLEAIWSWVNQYPLGFWAPSQVLSGNAIDNDWARMLIQGGPWLLCLWIWFLVVVARRTSLAGTTFLLPAVAVASLSLSQLVVGRPTGLLLLMLLGYHVRSEAEAPSDAVVPSVAERASDLTATLLDRLPRSVESAEITPLRPVVHSPLFERSA